MKRATCLAPVRVIDLLVEGPRRNEKVKRRLERLLRIVEDRVEAVPSCGPQCTGRVDQPGKCHGHDLVGCVRQRHLVHGICGRVVQVLVALDAAAEAADAHQIRLDVGAPLGLGPRRPALLKANGGVGGEGRGATGRRGVQGIAVGIGADAVVVDLVEIVVAIPCQGLLFCVKGHSC